MRAPQGSVIRLNPGGRTQIMSPDMAMRLVLLVVIASLIIVSIAMSDDTYGRKRSTPKRQPAEAGSANHD
jgi:hypothetical protein